MCRLEAIGYCFRATCSFAHHYSQLRLRPEADRSHLGALRMMTYWVDRSYGRQFFMSFYGPHRARCAYCGASFDIATCDWLYPVCGRWCETEVALAGGLYGRDFGYGHGIADCEVLEAATSRRWASVRYSDRDGWAGERRTYED